MLEPGDTTKLPAQRTASELDAELAEVQRLIVQLMDRLAEQVLGQIQDTRSMADQIEAMRAQLRTAAPPHDDAAHLTEAHLRRLSWRFSDALRGLPEYQWDGFVDSCVQLAQMLQHAEQLADDGAA
jgi:hypothetical protein